MDGGALGLKKQGNYQDGSKKWPIIIDDEADCIRDEMPAAPVATPSPPATSGSGARRLTLERLGNFDDFLTHILLDSQKGMKSLKFFDAIYQDCEDCDRIFLILDGIASGGNILDAESKLLALSSFRKFVTFLNTDEREDFRQHLRRYLVVFLPECAFEISRTNRFDGATYQANVTARKLILSGQEIEFLCGICVKLTAQQEDDLAQRQRDFSIVRTTRTKQICCMLGPVRFSNHDCKANAKFAPSTLGGIKAVALRKIKPGEEITLYYSDDYFGDRNRDCLCTTCANKCPIGEGTVDQSTQDYLSSVRYSLRTREEGAMYKTQIRKQRKKKQCESRRNRVTMRLEGYLQSSLPRIRTG